MFFLAVAAKRFLRYLCFTFLSLPFFVSAAASADIAKKLNEHKVKAGIVYNFLKYSHWPTHEEQPGTQPQTSDEPLSVCLLGGDPFEGYLFPLRGRTAQQKTINIDITNSLDTLRRCHLVFIHSGQEKRLDKILESLEGRSVLTMSDIKHFKKMGGMVEFSVGGDNHIYYEINNTALNAAGIQIEERLRKLAK